MEKDADPSFPDINRKCRAAHLIADWTCRLHYLIAETLGKILLPVLACEAPLILPDIVFTSIGCAA